MPPASRAQAELQHKKNKVTQDPPAQSPFEADAILSSSPTHTVSFSSKLAHPISSPASISLTHTTAANSRPRTSALLATIPSAASLARAHLAKSTLLRTNSSTAPRYHSSDSRQLRVVWLMRPGCTEVGQERRCQPRPRNSPSSTIPTCSHRPPLRSNSHRVAGMAGLGILPRR